jgi:hypothetical protein
MAQLRAKQIKLGAADDLLIGGSGGNGSVLSKGAAGTVLKVLAGGALGYEKAIAADTTFTPAGTIAATTVQAAIEEVATDAATALSGAISQEVTDRNTAISDAVAAEALLRDAADDALDGRVTTLEGAVGDNIDGLQTEVDAIETAVGLSSTGTFETVTGSTFLGSATTVVGLAVALDAALDAVKTTADAAATDADLQALDTRVGTAESDITALEGDLAAEVTARENADLAIDVELNAIEATVGAKIDGSANLYANGNFIIGGSAEIPEDASDPENVIPAVPAVAPDNHTVAIGKIDAALKDEETARVSADSAMLTEINAIETGAGLSVTGTYSANGSANYIGAATSLKNADDLLDAAIKTVADNLATLESTGVDALQSELDATQTAVGLNANGSLTAFTGGNVDGETTIVGAISAVDTALVTAQGDISTLQGNITALTNLDTLVFKGVITGATDATALEVLEAAAENGDVYRINTVGAAVFADQDFDVNVGDFVAYVGSGVWVKFDNTDPTFETTDNNLEITGDTYQGFTIALQNKGELSSANSAITIGANSALLDDLAITFNAGSVNFSDLAGVNAPGVGQEGKFLKWTSTGLAYVTAAELGVAVRFEEDFTPTTAANAAVTLAHTPVGDVGVFINGVKLKKAGFTQVGTTVTLVDSANGYGVETGDVVSVSYDYAS